MSGKVRSHKMLRHICFTIGDVQNHILKGMTDRSKKMNENGKRKENDEPNRILSLCE